MTQIGEQLRYHAEQSERRVRVISDVPLSSFGITTGKNPQLNLHSQPVTALRIQDTLGDIYAVVFHGQPLAGAQLLAVENAVSQSDQSMEGVLADFRMPGQAAISRKTRVRNQLRARQVPDASPKWETDRLDHIHSQDPRVAGSYREFKAQGLDKWIKAHKYEGFDPLFSLVSSTSMLDADEFNNAYSFNFQPVPLPRLHEKFFSGFGCENSWKMLQALNLDDGSSIRDFSKRYPNVHKFVLDSLNGVQSAYLAFNSVVQQQVSTVINDFLSILPREEYKKFATWSILSNYDFKKRVMNGETGKYYDDTGGWNEIPKFNVASANKIIRLEDKLGNALAIKKGRKIQDTDRGYMPTGLYKPEIVNYEFSEEYEANALIGAVIYRKKQDGTRVFVERNEARRIFQAQGLPFEPQWDLFAGRLMAVYFSPEELTKDWDRKISLEGAKIDPYTKLPFKQPQANTAMTIWHSLPGHKEILLSDKCPLWKGVEQQFR